MSTTIEYQTETQLIEQLKAERDRRRAGQSIQEQTEQLSRSLSSFIRHAWHVVRPHDRFVAGWHLDAMSEHLEAVSAGDIRRLQIWVPPGSMKPVDENALVLRGDGRRVPLRDIEVGDEVITHTGRRRRVTGVHAQGLLPTLRVETDCGRVTHAAPDHPFLTPEGWIRADHLRVGMRLANVVEPDTQGRRSLPEEARLAGYFVGDGNCTYGQNRRSLASNITCHDPVQGDDIVHCAETLGFVARYSAAKGVFRLNISGGARKWLERVGLAGHGSWTKRVPAFVMEGDKRTVVEFIGAYFACDGTLTKRAGDRTDLTVIFNSVNRDLLADVQHLLLRVGVQSRIRTHRGNGFRGPDYISWKLTITSHNETAKFLARVPVIGQKAARLKAWSPERSQFDGPVIPDKIVAIEDGGMRQCRCLTVAGDASFTADDLVVHNSLTTSVFWPAWEWTFAPHIRYITGSYDLGLATDFAVAARDLIQSPWYQERWGSQFQMRSDANVKRHYINDQGGSRYATSPTGGGTGRHGHRILIDDPIDAQSADATSRTKIDEANTWYDGTLSTRTVDAKTHAEVIIMQRLARGDLAEHVLGYEDWTVLSLPERYEQHHPFVVPGRVKLGKRDALGDPRTVEGELLWPERVSELENQVRAKKLGAHRSAGQLQQRPAAREGGVLKRALWSYYDKDYLDDVFDEEGRPRLPRLPAFPMIVSSWDTTFKDKNSSDFVAGGIWGVTGADRYMLRVIVAQMSLSLTSASMLELRQWGLDRFPHASHRVLVENTANGPEIIARLKREIPGVVATRPSVAADQPAVKKTVRAEACEPEFEAGNVFLPGAKVDATGNYDQALTPAWAQEVVEQAADFPNGEHDDIVDMVTQLLNWAREHSHRPMRGAGAQRMRPTRVGGLIGGNI